MQGGEGQGDSLVRQTHAEQKDNARQWQKLVDTSTTTHYPPPTNAQAAQPAAR